MSNELIHAQIAIAELLSFISSSNADYDGHWAHTYRNITKKVIEKSSILFEDWTLHDHICAAFEVN